MGNKNLIFGILIIAATFILQSAFASAATSQATVCAQYTIFGGWCQNVPMDQVASTLPDGSPAQYQPGACSATDFCRDGTCVNTLTGGCLPSSQRRCDPALGGQWQPTLPTDTGQCREGCCFIGDQARLTTDAGCGILASNMGVSKNFDASINSQSECSSLAFPQQKGACVYSNGGTTTCKFTTNRDCVTQVKGSFHANLLCTNPNLGTNCVKKQTTTCLDGVDQVYYMDSCGNTANIYDASKYNNPDYWSVYITDPTILESTVDVTNPESQKTNGNCNYQAGSMCMPYNARVDGNIKPEIGNNLCRNIHCSSSTDPFVQIFEQTYGASRAAKGMPAYPLNGEAWCGTEDATGITLNILNQEPNKNFGNPGSTLTNSPYTQDDKKDSSGKKYYTGGISSQYNGVEWYKRPAQLLTIDKTGNLPGSEDVLFICQNGKVTPEVGIGRQEICNQSINSTTGIINAYLIANNWRFCYGQNSSKSCYAAGDCQWVSGYSTQYTSNGLTASPLLYDPSQDQLTQMSGDANSDQRQGGSCVPRYPPGFDYSVPSASGSSQTNSPQSTGDVTGQQMCARASISCYANYTKGTIGDWTVDNPWAYNISCFYDNGNRAEPFNSSELALCSSIGDCGISSNYLGMPGQNTEKDSFKETKGGTGEAYKF